jgi:uncharacterized protein (DUF2236 family)
MSPAVHHLGDLGPPPASVHSRAMLGPETVAAHLLGHPVLLLGGPRALLLQLAHPSVAAGVAQHSGFRADPFDRLLRTVSAMGTIAFADPASSRRALAAVQRSHRRVRGRRPDGQAYSATDPRLAAWVHATLVDTALVVERRWLGRLSDGERACFYRETMALAAAFGVPEDVLPADVEGFSAWVQAEAAALSVTEQARAMAEEVLRPPLRRAWGRLGPAGERAAWPVLRLVTADLLPPPLRRAYGLPEVDGAREAALRAASALARALSPLAPAGRPDGPTRAAALATGSRL